MAGGIPIESRGHCAGAKLRQERVVGSLCLTRRKCARLVDIESRFECRCSAGIFRFRGILVEMHNMPFETVFFDPITENMRHDPNH